MENPDGPSGQDSFMKQGLGVPDSFQRLGTAWTGRLCRMPLEPVAFKNHVRAFWQQPTTYSLMSTWEHFPYRWQGALARCTLGESERSQSWNAELYYYKKLNQIKHCKQNSGEDQAVSLLLVADTSVAGIELQRSVSQFLPMSCYWVIRTVTSYQWWMRNKGVQQKKKDNIKILHFLFEINLHLLHATPHFRRLTIFLINSTPENVLQIKWKSNPRN